MHLHSVRVFAKPTVIRSEAGFHICHIPWLGAENSEHGGRIHGPGAYLFTEWLPDNASLVCPESLQAEDEFLEGQFWLHLFCSFSVSKAFRFFYPESRLNGISDTLGFPFLWICLI
jgi:hypothetical protein